SGLHVEAIIVNRGLPDGGPCPLCDRRRSLEEAVIKKIARGIGRGREVRVVPAEIREPTGVKALAKIGRALVSPASSFDKLRMSGLRHQRLVVRRPSDSLVLSLSKDEHTTGPEALDAFKGAKLLFFGG